MTKLKVFLLFFVLFVTFAFGHTYHGVSMASNTLKGWVVANDTRDYVLHTPDCGFTWINQSFYSYRYLYDIFFLNEQSGWIGTDAGFIYNTQNGGLNWQCQCMGLAYFAYRVFFIDDSCGWVSCSGAIIGRTVHGGQNYSWEQIMLPYPQFHDDTVDFCGVTSFDSLTCWICAGKTPEFWYNETLFTKGQGYVVKLTNGGQNWQLLHRDTINDFFDIKMLDTLNGFVIGGNDRTMSATVMKTQNGGVTWQNVTIPSQAKYLRSLKFIGNQAWAVGHNGTILHSDNGGNNWALQTSPVDTTLYDVDFSDSIHGLIAGDGCVLYTHNGGNTWNISNVGVKEEIASLPLAMTAGVKVYPNPAKSFLTIRLLCERLPTGEIELGLGNPSHNILKFYDISGKLIKEIALPSTHNGNMIQMRIPFNDISAGVYFVTLESEPKRIVERLVIVK